MRVGIVAFIVPFAFVVNPALIGRAEPNEILIASLTALIGVVFLAGGFSGFLLSRLTIFSRLIHVLVGFLLFIPNPNFSIVGGAMAIVIVLAELIQSKLWPTILRKDTSSDTNEKSRN
jgi:TRAP-type uncharacterized transport system fused permease subunit